MTGLGLIESPVRVDMTLSPNWRERQEPPLAPSGETYSIVDVGAWPSTLNRQRSSRWNGLEFLAHSGGVVAGARRCFVPCSYPYPISIKIFSDHGLPRNSIPMGTPSTAVGVGGENPLAPQSKGTQLPIRGHRYVPLASRVPRDRVGSGLLLQFGLHHPRTVPSRCRHASVSVRPLLIIQRGSRCHNTPIWRRNPT